MNICILAFSDLGLVGEGFSYALPDGLVVSPGEMVIVPFGKVKKRGVVVRVDEVEKTERELSVIIEKCDHPFMRFDASTVLRMKLILFIAHYYFSPLHKVVKLFFPQGIWSGTFTPHYDQWYVFPSEQPLLSKQERGLLALQGKREEGKEYTMKEVSNLASRPMIKKALEKGILRVQRAELISPQTRVSLVTSSSSSHDLTVEQQYAWEEIRTHGYKKPLLVHGVTGSGKTELYLRLAHHLAREGKQTIILVPEISLTPQLHTYVQEWFGERCALLHSHLAMGERQQEWVRIASGAVDVVLGSRSALFAPLASYGAIIIDECHEWTYKNEQHPRYHAVRVAEELFHETNKTNTPCMLLLGSATPSIEQYAATQGDSPTYHLITMKKRVY